MEMKPDQRFMQSFVYRDEYRHYLGMPVILQFRQSRRVTLLSIEFCPPHIESLKATHLKRNLVRSSSLNILISFWNLNSLID